MADIYVLLRAGQPPLFAWAEGRGWQCSDKLPRSKAGRGDAVAIIPGTNVLSLKAVLNARSENEARRMAPFAIEDELAQAPEDVHVALGPKAAPGQARALGVISQDVMAGIVSELEAIGLSDAAIVSADALLPQGNVLVQANDQILARIGDRSFTIDAEIGADMIAGLLPDGAEIEVYGEALARNIGVAPAGGGFDNDEMLLSSLAAWHANGDGGVNLRQGRFGVRRELDLSGFGQWRTAGLLAAACVLGYFALILGQAYAYKVQAGEYRDSAREYAQEGWPNLGGNVDAVLSEVGTGSVIVDGRMNVLGATATLYHGIEAVPGVKLMSIRFDETRQQYSAVLALQGFEDGDALISAMKGFGLDVEIGEARMLGGQLVGELVLRPKQ